MFLISLGKFPVHPRLTLVSHFNKSQSLRQVISNREFLLK